jgi:hypothetical protein
MDRQQFPNPYQVTALMMKAANPSKSHNKLGRSIYIALTVCEEPLSRQLYFHEVSSFGKVSSCKKLSLENFFYQKASS